MFRRIQTWRSSSRLRLTLSKPLWSFYCAMTMAGLTCLPGCSGCQSQSSSSKPPLAEQAETSTTEAEKPSKPDGASGSDGSLAEMNPARGDSESGSAEKLGRASDSASSGKNPTKSAAGDGTAQRDSEAGSSGGEGGRSGGGSPNGKKKSSSQPGKPSSPGEAVAMAQTLKRRSDKAADKKEYGQAFELATKAWESVQTFPKDGDCREMSAELQRRIDQLATLANSQLGSDLKRDKPLIVR